jgi:regulator of protease activity HflC (stomatin/prohibitin superfamily)
MHPGLNAGYLPSLTLDLTRLIIITLFELLFTSIPGHFFAACSLKISGADTHMSQTHSPTPVPAFSTQPSRSNNFESRIKTFWWCLVILTVVPLPIGILLLWFQPPAGYVILGLWCLIVIVAVKMARSFGSAKHTALDKGEADVFRGLIRVVAWEPTEGILILKNKKITFWAHSIHNGGGVGLLLPYTGEQVALKVPLEYQTLQFQDNNVLTREYVPLVVKGTIYWQIEKLDSFYTLISQEVHFADDKGSHKVVKRQRHPKIEVAEHWLRQFAEEETRKVFSGVSTGLLLASRISNSFTSNPVSPTSTATPTGNTNDYHDATNRLARAIRDEVDSRVAKFGLKIHDVALQEVELPKEIISAATDAVKAFYLPLEAAHKAEAQIITTHGQLKGQIDLLGVDNVAAQQLLKAAPNHPGPNLAMFFDAWVHQAMTARGALPPQASQPAVPSQPPTSTPNP